MSPVHAPKSRRLSLARETLRALTDRSYAAITIQQQVITSCGDPGCACPDRTAEY